MFFCEVTFKALKLYLHVLTLTLESKEPLFANCELFVLTIHDLLPRVNNLFNKKTTCNGFNRPNGHADYGAISFRSRLQVRYLTDMQLLFTLLQS